jgi:hypothetical protein
MCHAGSCPVCQNDTRRGPIRHKQEARDEQVLANFDHEAGCSVRLASHGANRQHLGMQQRLGAPAAVGLFGRLPNGGRKFLLMRTGAAIGTGNKTSLGKARGRSAGAGSPLRQTALWFGRLPLLSALLVSRVAVGYGQTVGVRHRVGPWDHVLHDSLGLVEPRISRLVRP